MNKKCIYISLIPILCILVFFITKDNSKKFEINGIKYSVSVNGIVKKEFPTKGSYAVDLTCVGGKGVWNYDEWLVEIYDIEAGNVGCNVRFDSKSKEYLNNHIKNTLAGKTVGNGQVVYENGYRYEGKNPNNYVMFNNELWRIIGVFDSSSHGQNGEYLTKIIREDSIGGLIWDKNNNNNWATSSLYKLLNGAYYNAQDGTNSGYCYRSNLEDTPISEICDYRKIGIQEEYRNMVKNVTWYIGEYNNYEVTADNAYNFERGSVTNKTANGYIGLMYVSDYMYSAIANSCQRTSKLIDYGKAKCSGNLWLSASSNQWSINKYLKYSNGIRSEGIILLDIFYFEKASRPLQSSNLTGSVLPTLYLDSSVYIITGDGSITNPYIIGM